MLLAAAVFIPGPMRWFFVIFGLLVLARWLLPGDKPTELDADVWVPDDAERAQRLEAKVTAWRRQQG